MSELGILRILFIIYLLITRINIFGYNLHKVNMTIPMALFAIITIFLYAKKYYLNPKKLINKYIIIPLFFTLVCIMSTFINVSRLPIFNVVVNIIIFNLLFFIDEENITKEKNIIFNILCHSISIVSILSFIYMILEKLFFKTNYSFFQLTRFVGAVRYYENPNGVAITAFIGLALCLLLFNKNKILYLIYSIFNFISIILTNSRSVMLSLICLVFILLIYLIIIGKISKKTIYFGTFITFLLVFMIINKNRIYNEVSIFNSNKIENFLNDITNFRYSMYKEALFLAFKKPILGNGLNTFVENSKTYFGINSYALVYTKENPHNIFIALFYYTGIVGLSLISYLFYLILNTARKKLDFENIVYLIIFFGVILYSCLDVNILFHVQLTGFVFWLVSGYMINLKS